MAKDKDVKFTDDEMTKINELQGAYVNLQNALGQVGISRIRLEQQFDNLELNEKNIKDKFAETQKNEKDFVDSINKKYGDGNLDLQSGVFTPKPTEEISEKTL